MPGQGIENRIVGSKSQMEEGVIPAVIWSSAIMPVLFEGHNLRIPVSGFSMSPLIVGGRDEVILSSAEGRKLKRGDIVLYVRDDGTHVLHRVHHITDDGCFMVGDAQTWIEGPVERQKVLAVAEAVIRKGRMISCKGSGYKLISEVWLFLRPVRPVVMRLVNIILNLLKR
jgi:signal peptidase